jgi:branched-chain amino acid aminotransferase
MGAPTSAGAWVDGTVLDPADATVSVFDRSFTVGDGAFETLKVVDGTAFALSRHLARLHRSVDTLGFTIACSDDEIRAGVEAAIAACTDERGTGVVRITASAGAGKPGSQRPSPPDPTLAIIAVGTDPWPETADVITIPHVRNERGLVVGLKSTAYADNVIALHRAADAGASEAILGNVSGDLCEGTGTNIFLAREGRLLTPPLSSGCLAGVTRELLLEVVDVDVEPMPLEDLAQADEAFLASSTRDVQAIRLVDGVALSDSPGPLTKAAAEAFAALEARDLDP